MKLGAETNTRWLWFIAYILLPLNVIGQIFGLFWLLDADLGEIGILFILAELGLAVATIIGLHQFKPWGWYCIMVVFGIQLVGTPLKVHAKASLRYEVTQAANSYLQSEGRSPLTTSTPSIFDFEPMLTFFLLFAIWTVPNAIYLYRRRSLFAFSTSSDNGMNQGLKSPSLIGVSAPRNNVVTSMEEQAYANAQQEYESGKVREGLMVKVSTEEPDQQKQRLLYIRYRAQQLFLEMQRRDVIANEEARKATAKIWLTHVTKQLFIAVLLFFIPVFSWVGIEFGYGLIGYMLFGLVLWALYSLLLLWGRCSRIWLAIPAVCIVCHLLSRYYTWWIVRTVSWVTPFLAIPYFIVAMVKISRSRSPASRASVCTKEDDNVQKSWLSY